MTSQWGAFVRWRVKWNTLYLISTSRSHMDFRVSYPWSHKTSLPCDRHDQFENIITSLLQGILPLNLAGWWLRWWDSARKCLTCHKILVFIITSLFISLNLHCSFMKLTVLKFSVLSFCSSYQLFVFSCKS